MKVTTTRFGELKVQEDEVLSFKEGILGFQDLKKFFIVDPGDKTLILWLQSIENPKIAFPIIEPKIFKHDYTAKLLPADLQALEMESLGNAKVYCIITIPSDVSQMSANLKAPIVINSEKSLAKQVVLQDSKLPVGHPMYKELKQNIVATSSDDSNRTSVSAPSASANSEANEETIAPAATRAPELEA